VLRRWNLKLQFDFYHRQILHGDVTTALRRLMPLIGHIQIASVPSRSEPDGEELNIPRPARPRGSLAANTGRAAEGATASAGLRRIVPVPCKPRPGLLSRP
jgi:sugar phosphate isomerase/epimerase